MYANKEVGVQISKRNRTPGSYKGEVVLKSSLAPLPPPNAPLDVENGLYRPWLQIYIAV